MNPRVLLAEVRESDSCQRKAAQRVDEVDAFAHHAVTRNAPIGCGIPLMRTSTLCIPGWGFRVVCTFNDTVARNA